MNGVPDDQLPLTALQGPEQPLAVAAKLSLQLGVLMSKPLDLFLESFQRRLA